MQSLHGIRFKPIATVDGTLLGLDARWLGVQGWGFLLLLGLLAVAVTPGDFSAARCLAGVSIIAAVVLTSVGHELGHVIASRVAGLPVRAVVLAPHGGATVHARSDLALVNAFTALGGPLANVTIGATCLAIVLQIGVDTPAGMFVVELAALQFLTAALNLLPWSTMDGRQVLAAIRG